MSTQLLQIHFKSDEIRKLHQENGGFADSVSSGYDLPVPKDIDFTEPFELKMIDFGIVVKAPPEFHIILLPRSSTYRKYGLLQANSIGLVDNNYCGKYDTLQFPVIWVPSIHEGKIGLFTSTTSQEIPRGTRIAQLILQPIHRMTLQEFTPEDKSRGGCGSTGN